MQGKGETNDHPPGCKRPSIQLLYKLATQAASTAFISLYNPCTTQCQLHPLFSYRRDAGFITLWCKTPAYCNAARSKCLYYLVFVLPENQAANEHRGFNGQGLPAINVCSCVTSRATCSRMTCIQQLNPQIGTM